MDKKSVIFILGLIFIKDWKYGVNPENQETLAVKDYSQDPNLGQSQPIEQDNNQNPQEAYIEFQQIFKPEILPTEEPVQSKSTQRKLDNVPKQSILQKALKTLKKPLGGAMVVVPVIYVFVVKRFNISFSNSNTLAYSAKTSKIIKFFNDKTITPGTIDRAKFSQPEVAQDFQMFFYNKVVNDIVKIKKEVVDFSNIEALINPYNRFFDKFDDKATGFELIKTIVYLRFNDYLKLNINCYSQEDVKKFIEPLEKILGWLFQMFDPQLYQNFNFQEVQNGSNYFIGRLSNSPLLSFLSFVVSETAVSQYKNPEVLRKLINLFEKITTNKQLMENNIFYKFKNQKLVDEFTLTIQLTNEIQNSSNKKEKAIEILDKFEKSFSYIASNKIPVKDYKFLDNPEDLIWQ